MNNSYGLDIKTVSLTPSERWAQLPNWLLYSCCHASEDDVSVRAKAEAYEKAHNIPANKIIKYLKPLDQNQFCCQINKGSF